MNRKKEYIDKIHREAEMKLNTLYADDLLLKRFNSVKKELIKKYPLYEDFIKSLSYTRFQSKGSYLKEVIAEPKELITAKDF